MRTPTPKAKAPAPRLTRRGRPWVDDFIGVVSRGSIWMNEKGRKLKRR